MFYGAARTEALSVRGKPVHIIGGGNSAGQAAMLFANYAEHVTVLVRGPGLAASMSQYLIDQLEAKGNISLECLSEVTSFNGEDQLETITIRNSQTGAEHTEDSSAVFVFIGAEADTEWLVPAVVTDRLGYLCTGPDAPLSDGLWSLERDPYLLETSVPGVFAAGDVRSGSIKRVAAGVGEGSMAIAFVHQFLATTAL